MGKTVRAWRSMLCGFSTTKMDAALRDASLTDDKPQPRPDIFSFDPALFFMSLFTDCSVGSSAAELISTEWFGWVELTIGMEPFPLDSFNSLRRS